MCLFRIQHVIIKINVELELDRCTQKAGYNKINM